MRARDAISFALRAVAAQRLRTALTALGIAVGVAAVVLLTAIGEGVHRFVLAEFTQFGTNIVAVTPGRIATHGASPGIFGTERPLTIADAQALADLPGVVATMGLVQGNAAIEHRGRSRRTAVYGVGPAMPEIFRFGVAAGRFLPPDDPRAARPLVVLGAKVRAELFGARAPLGAPVRVGGYRFRVVGVMEPKGQVLGFDMDDAVYVPTARALEIFDREGVMEVDILYEAGTPVNRITESVTARLRARHGRVDFNLTTQADMLATLGSVLSVLTLAIGGLGAISLVVGGIGIVTILTIAVAERTGEIGLLRALGASRRQVGWLFLGEAAMLAALGGLAGLVLGLGAAQVLGVLLPGLPVQTAWRYVLLAEAVALGIGLLAGLLPAMRAARLDPVAALRTE